MTSSAPLNRPLPQLVVCLNCDLTRERMHTPQAMGRAWFKRLKALFAGEEIKVTSVNCLGGCDCVTGGGAVAGCCSLGLMGEGRFGYVLNQFEPDGDEGKVRELVRRYVARADGKLSCADEPNLIKHIATRLPPLK